MSKSSPPAPIRIGLVGFGNIGSAVIRWLQQNAKVINGRLPRPLELARIADVNITADRGVNVDRRILTTDYQEILNDPTIEIVIELIGGTGIALKVVEGSLRAGKHVVTANKALLATHGADLMALAAEKKVILAGEASVGAGIPILRAMHQSLCPNRFTAVAGIINGTTNYILTEMEATGRAFGDVLGDAQRLGYAEPDPTFDIEGIDAAHKLAILASLAFEQDVRIGDVRCTGITRLRPAHFAWAERNGLRIKLVALARPGRDGGVDAAVGPTFVRRDGDLGRIMGVFNAVLLMGEPIGKVMMTGRGAGQESTSSGVLSDVMVIAAAISEGGAGRECLLRWPKGKQATFDPAMSEGEYVIALEVEDAGASAARIFEAIGATRVRLERWECQPMSAAGAEAGGGANGGYCLWLQTARTVRRDVDNATDRLMKAGLLRDQPILFRLEREL